MGNAEAAQRFGSAYQLGASAAIQLSVAYHTGEWQRAVELSSRFSSGSMGNPDAMGGAIRGLIRLARGDVLAARAAGQAVIDYATSAANDEALLHGLALVASTHHLRGEADETRAACRRFLQRWQAIGGMQILTPALTIVAAIPGQEADIAAAAALQVPASRWRPALIAMAERRYGDAAALYGEIGSLPLEASARLLAAAAARAAGHTAEASDQAQLALTFYRRREASLYVEQAERYLRRPA